MQIESDAKKIVKITLEFEDHYLIFEGETALQWIIAADNAALYASSHGQDYFKNIDFDKAYKKNK